MKKLIAIAQVLITVFFFSCKEENTPIVPNQPEELSCRISPEETYAACFSNPDSTSFEVVTWNLELFPHQGDRTIDEVEELLENMSADIIALQEINDISDFEGLDERLPNWESQIFDLGSFNLGYIYNTCEINNISDVRLVDIGDSYSFPRKPIEITATHKNGLEVTLINIHLKCCNDGYLRRIAASEELKNYIDSNYPDQNVILLGDFNDDIHESNSPFINFVEDANDYRFADMDIALGSSEHWSYPSWPSHIDHILVSNELFDNVGEVKTLHIEECTPTYPGIVSDHRPIMVSLIGE